jgi:hypothetical protein
MITPTAAMTAFANPITNPGPLLSMSSPTLHSIPSLAMATGAYLTVTNTLYLARRSYLRKMTMKRLLQIRTTREPKVSMRLYFTMLLVWQTFVVIFPIVEPLARCMGQVSFFYSYPNAGGVGIIFEPRDVQHMKQNHRTKHQVRFDWHRFSVNVGGIGRDGFRHPPSVVRNLPHVDIPKRGLKHWPWRRRRR